MQNEIFDEQKIFNILDVARSPATEYVKEILNKARRMKGLELEEVGALINCQDKGILPLIFETAKFIKQQIYGERLVFFAPLYISSFCVNDCEYCGFHLRNASLRKKLSLEEVRQQAEFLIDMGHKRLLLEFGEDPLHSPISYVTGVIKTIY